MAEDDSDIMFDGHNIEKYGHRWSIGSVRHESRLNHNKEIVNILFVRGMAKSPSA